MTCEKALQCERQGAFGELKTVQNKWKARCMSASVRD